MEEREQREAILRAIVASVREAIVVLDQQGRVTFWNPAAEQLFGYSQEEVLGRDLHRLLAVDSAQYEAYREALTRLQTTGESTLVGKTKELKAKHKDGREMPVEVSLAFLRAGQSWQAVGIVRDIRERKEAEEALRHKEKQLRAMLEAIPHPAFLINKGRRIEALNRAGQGLGAFKGGYCWAGIHGLQAISAEEREAFLKTGTPLPGTKCYFCRADEALAEQKTENGEVVLGGVVWDTWWIPVDVDLFLHYVVDVTKYKKMEEELHRLSITDPLTSAYNRRHFLEVLDKEIERTRRTGQPFSLIMIDLDHFKTVNDRYGHAAGDLVLKSLVEMLKKRLRRTDCLARWGGEEFLILLPYTPVEKAAGLAEELRQRVNNMIIPGVGHFSASFGVVGYCPGDTVDSLIQRVDSKLYAAKAGGRNRVEYGNDC